MKQSGAIAMVQDVTTIKTCVCVVNIPHQEHSYCPLPSHSLVYYSAIFAHQTVFAGQIMAIASISRGLLSSLTGQGKRTVVFQIDPSLLVGIKKVNIQLIACTSDADSFGELSPMHNGAESIDFKGFSNTTFWFFRVSVR